jgi:hypothetical protein
VLLLLVTVAEIPAGTLLYQRLFRETIAVVARAQLDASVPNCKPVDRLDRMLPIVLLKKFNPLMPFPLMQLSTPLPQPCPLAPEVI